MIIQEYLSFVRNIREVFFTDLENNCYVLGDFPVFHDFINIRLSGSSLQVNNVMISLY